MNPIVPLAIANASLTAQSFYSIVAKQAVGLRSESAARRWSPKRDPGLVLAVPRPVARPAAPTVVGPLPSLLGSAAMLLAVAFGAHACAGVPLIALSAIIGATVGVLCALREAAQ